MPLCRIDDLPAGGRHAARRRAVNHVVLIGRLEQHPEPRSRTAGDACVLRLAVSRRRPVGQREPGVTYLDVTVPWPRARDCIELREGMILAVSGLIERNEWREGGEWHSSLEIIADWIEQIRGNHRQGESSGSKSRG
jgi:single-stranded DNA-binding protein